MPPVHATDSCPHCVGAEYENENGATEGRDARRRMPSWNEGRRCLVEDMTQNLKGYQDVANGERCVYGRRANDA